MKICHLCTGFELSYQGGITNYVRALAESQQSAGNNVWVVAGNPKQEYCYQVKRYKSDRIKPFRYSPLVDKEGLNELRAFLEKEQFDIIHIHMVLDIDWDLYDILKPYKYVVSLHDYFFLCPRIVMMQPDNTLCTKYDQDKCSKCISWFNTVPLLNATEYQLQNHFGLKNFHFPLIKQNMTTIRFEKMKKMLENACLLLPVSLRVREIYEQSGIKGNYRMLHIGNITADRFVPEFRTNEGINTLNVVMLGSLNYIKGADLFLKLAEQLDKEKFRVHFYGRSAAYAEKLRDAGIFDHGPYMQDELPEILSDSDIGCVLSVWEDNGPQVVMEMLNNHVPVIGTRMGGIPDFVHDGENGFLFDPYSQESFNCLVERLNCLTRQDIIRLKRNIRPTMTTYDHAKAVDEAYRHVLSD